MCKSYGKAALKTNQGILPFNLLRMCPCSKFAERTSKYTSHDFATKRKQSFHVTANDPLHPPPSYRPIRHFCMYLCLVQKEKQRNLKGGNIKQFNFLEFNRSFPCPIDSSLIVSHRVFSVALFTGLVALKLNNL